MPIQTPCAKRIAQKLLKNEVEINPTTSKTVPTAIKLLRYPRSSRMPAGRQPTVVKKSWMEPIQAMEAASTSGIRVLT